MAGRVRWVTSYLLQLDTFGVKLVPCVCRTVPERVCQAETVFLRVAAYRERWAEVPCSSGASFSVNPACLPLSRFRDSSRLSSLREVAIVLYKRDCSQH